MTLKTQTTTTQAGAVYLAKSAGFQRYAWGGRVMRVDPSTKNIGGLSTTTRLNPRGGIEIDRLNQDVPGTTDIALIMKYELASRAKTDLLKCFINIDRRLNCVQGRDKDAPDQWDEIVRTMYAKATTREIPASSYAGEEDAEITLSYQALGQYDIYRLTSEEAAGVIANAASIVAVDVAIPEGCGDCGPSEDGTFVAVTTLEAAGSPVLLVNSAGGDADDWTAIVLTEWTTAAASDVGALGNFVLILSNGEGEVLRSDDGGTTRVTVTNSDFAANGPNKVAMADQNNIVIVGDNGYIYRSDDGARSIETVSGGLVTTEKLTDVRFAPNDYLTVFACGENDALLKSENGGESWFALTAPTSSKDLIALGIRSEYEILLLDEDGVIWESADGGETWAQQTALQDLPGTPVTAGEFAITAPDVIMLTLTDGTGSAVYRNVSGGYQGFWETEHTEAAVVIPCIAALDQNRYVAAGGDGSTTNYALLRS